MRNGWYESSLGLVHYVDDGHYACNGAVGIKVVRKWKKDQMIDNLTCKNCARKKIE